MKRNLLLVGLLYMSMILGAQTNLTLGSDIWPPFTNTDSKTSLALDIVKEGLSRGEVQMTSSILEFKEVLSEIN